MDSPLIRQRPFERMLTAHMEEKNRILEEAKTREINKHLQKHLTTMHAWAVNSLSLDHVLTPEEYSDILPRAGEWHKKCLKKGINGSAVWMLGVGAGFCVSSLSPILSLLWGIVFIGQLFVAGLIGIKQPPCWLTDVINHFFVKPVSFLRYGHYGDLTGKILLPYTEEERNTIKQEYIRLFIK